MRAHRYRLERAQFIPRSRDTVFRFFADAGNLELLTPDFLHFRILTPMPIALRAGTLIDYQLRLFSIPIRWRTRIDVYKPPRHFTDIQLLGPYRYWHHVHTFFDMPGGTLVVDRIDYELPYGAFGTVAHDLFVRRTLERIFDYRRESLEHHFALPLREPDHAKYRTTEEREQKASVRLPPLPLGEGRGAGLSDARDEGI